jgi:hypothetical protein
MLFLLNQPIPNVDDSSGTDGNISFVSYDYNCISGAIDFG